jgi:hypothetical protein
MVRALALLLAACSPIEDLPSQAEQIYRGLSECPGELGDADFDACGEAVLDGFQMEWDCRCPESYTVEPWSVCGTRDDVLGEINEFSVECTCDRVGTCG